MQKARDEEGLRCANCETTLLFINKNPKSTYSLNHVTTRQLYLEKEILLPLSALSQTSSVARDPLYPPGQGQGEMESEFE